MLMILYSYSNPKMKLISSCNILINQHPKIKFTCEIEKNGHHFLDIDISRDKNPFVASGYRKPTCTDFTTNFISYILVKYTGNLILTLIIRAFKISKDYFIFSKEVDFSTNILKKNMFTIIFTERNFKKTLNRLLVPGEP